MTVKPVECEVKSKPRYSGPGRTGVCKCGHSWEEHHLGLVMNQEYFHQTGEAYVPQECEHFGCNEYGGMMPDPNNFGGPWIAHCGNYEDTGGTEMITALKVQCSGAHEDCPRGCPHRKPHRPHKARQTEWDGIEPCTVFQPCGALNTSREGLAVMCKEV